MKNFIKRAVSVLFLVVSVIPAYAQDPELQSQIGAMKAFPTQDNARCVPYAANFHGVNPWVLKAIIKVESGFNAQAINRNANGTVDVGLAQMNSMHFKELKKYGIEPGHLFDACVATYVAAWHLAKQVKAYGNSWFAVGAYHSATPCFNQRYTGLIWNALSDWQVVSGQKVKVPSLAQCGYKAPNQSEQVTSKRKSGGTSVASASSITFDQ